MVNYNLTFIDNSAYVSGEIIASSTYAITQKLGIINDSIIIDNEQYVHSIHFWNGNTYLGHYTLNNTAEYTGNYYLGEWNYVIPNNATDFAFQIHKDGFTGTYAVSFVNFQTVTASSTTTPERGIFKGRRNYLSFDGVNDYVDFGSGTISQEFDGSSYIEVEIDFELDVIKTDRQVLGDFVVADSSNSGQSMIYIVSRNNGSLWVGGRSNVNDTFQQVEFSSVLSPNTKYNVRALYDFQNDEIKVWLDNTLLGTQNVSFGSSTFQDSSFDGVNDIIGANSGGLSNYLNGDIYYFSILSNTTQVEYLFNEGSGTTLNDNVGNNDGTIYGATWGEEGAPLSAIYKGSPSYALSFDGVDDYAFNDNLSNVSLQNNNTWHLTMNIRIPNLSQTNTYTFAFRNGSQQMALIYGYKANKMELYVAGIVGITTQTLRDNTEITFNNNDFNKVEYIFNGTQYITKLNDIIIGTYNNNSSIIFNPNTLVIGGSNSTNGGDLSKLDINYLNFNINNNDLITYDFTEGSGTTLNDNVGNNDGTIVGATWFTVYDNEIQRVYKGAPSRYLSFDGVNDYVIANYSNTVNQFNNNDFSFTADFVMNSSPSNNVFIITIGGNGETLNDNVLHLYVDPSNNLHIFHEYGSGTNFDWNTNFTIQIGVRYQVYFTSDISSNNYSLYVNNQFIGSQTYPTAWQVASSNNIHNFILNDDQNLSGFYHDFDIYSISAWNKIISSSEANASFDKSLNGNEVGLITYYNFQDGSGTTLTDSAGNNDGTIYGATWKDDSLIYFPKTLDSIAYGNLTYRDIFEGTNLVSNGDFSNGTTGWLANNGTLSSSNGNLIYNVTSSTLYPTIIPTADSTVTGVRYYVATNVKANVSTLTPIILRIRDVPYTDIAQVTPSQNNVFTFLSGILTAPNVNRPRIDTSVASGDELVIDYMLQIDLDDLGIGNLSKEQMDELYNEYLFIKAYYS